jgi:cytochrome b561
MASWMVKLRALVAIALFLVLILTFISADEEDGEFGEDEGGMHVTAAYLMLGLAFLHMLLNYKVGIYELKALLGLDKASRSKRKG